MREIAYVYSHINMNRLRLGDVFKKLRAKMEKKSVLYIKAELGLFQWTDIRIGIIVRTARNEMEMWIPLMSNLGRGRYT